MAAYLFFRRLTFFTRATTVLGLIVSFALGFIHGLFDVDVMLPLIYFVIVMVGWALPIWIVAGSIQWLLRPPTADECAALDMMRRSS